MQTKRAIALANFIDEAYDVFGKVNKLEVKDKKELDKYKRKFTESNFEEKYEDFEDEMRENIDEYLNIKPIYDYILFSFMTFKNWHPFYDEDNQQIMKQGYEIQFLIKLKTNIVEYGIKLYELLEIDEHGETGEILNEFYDAKISENQDMIDEQSNTNNVFENRFDFQILKIECEEIEGLIGKTKHISERLFDFKQWQLQYDEIKEDLSNKKHYRYTTLYYPKFIALCNNELDRLNKLLDIDKKELTIKAIENSPVIIQQNEPSPYTWNANDTDLIELVAAMHASESIKRIDGNKLTQKELFDYFQDIFNIKLNNIHPALTKAGNRKTSITPFLNQLITAFENYVQKKEEKLTKRK